MGRRARVHADASADRVNAGITSSHGNLSAEARITDNTTDFDRTIEDFRHFLTEEFIEEHFTCTGKDHLGTVFSGVSHSLNHSLDGAALSKTFLRELFLERENSFSLTANRNDRIAAFDTEDFAIHDRTDAVTISVHDLAAFRIANALNEELLSSLDCLTAKGRDRKFHFEMVTRLNIRIQIASLFDEHVVFVHFLNGFCIERRVVVRIIVNDIDHESDRNFIRFTINLHIEVLVNVQVLASCRNQGILQSAFDNGVVDILRVNDGFKRFD